MLFLTTHHEGQQEAKEGAEPAKFYWRESVTPSNSYGPSIKLAEQAGEAEGSVGLDRLVSDGPRFVNPVMEQLPTNRPVTSQKPV